MATITERRLKFISRPHERRVGLIPLTVALLLAWIIAGFGIVSAAYAIKASAVWGILSLGIVVALMSYIVFITFQMFAGGKESYELTIDGDFISLTTLDELKRAKNIQQISLDDIELAEYYEPRDTCNLLLRGRAREVEIPLWSFGPEAETKIVNYIRNRGVKIIGIPNDIII